MYGMKLKDFEKNVMKRRQIG